MKFTAKGLPGHSRRHSRISRRRSSGVRCVSAVTVPSPPALDTAAARTAYPTWCIPPWMMGCSMPSSSVTRVLSGMVPLSRMRRGVCRRLIDKRSSSRRQLGRRKSAGPSTRAKSSLASTKVPTTCNS